jgi:hypothetical protein
MVHAPGPRIGWPLGGRIVWKLDLDCSAGTSAAHAQHFDRYVARAIGRLARAIGKGSHA